MHQGLPCPTIEPLHLIMDRWEISELVSGSHACSARKEMSVFSCACNALLIASCYTDECEEIQEESLLVTPERNKTAGTWTEPYRLVHAREGTREKIGGKQPDYFT